MTSHKDQPRLDDVIVGAGFVGLYMLNRLRTLGFRARVRSPREET